jgi:hypothetical protein
MKALLLAILLLGYTGGAAPLTHAQAQSCDVSDLMGATTVSCGGIGNTTRWTCGDSLLGPSCQTSSGGSGSCSSGFGSLSCSDNNLGGGGRTLDCNSILGNVSCSQRDTCSFLCNR